MKNACVKIVFASLFVMFAIWATRRNDLTLADSETNGKRVIVLGIDGMDYAIVKKMMSEGRLPNCSLLATEGTFMPLETSMPPLSPVAWTSFQTGCDPGQHGVFDFLVRDPQKVKKGFLPEDGVVEKKHIQKKETSIPFTSFQRPQAVTLKLRRKIAPFWDILEANGIEAVVYKMPANYPVAASQAQTLSGMGTPDMEGTYGRYTYITTSPSEASEEYGDARIRQGVIQDGKLYFKIEQKTETPFLSGPENPFKSEALSVTKRRVNVPFEVYVDTLQKSAAIVLPDCDLVLGEGDWSPWVKLTIELIPGIMSVEGQVRFYLKSATPLFRLFISPINLAPGSEGLATMKLDSELRDYCGYFYTKGMPEQTKAVSDGVFTTDEYIRQSNLVLQESLDALAYLVSQKRKGVLFFYISTLDLDSHEMWKHREPGHPAHDFLQSAKYTNYLEDRYQKMDAIIGWVRSCLAPDDTLYVMSDHGFTSFRREVNIPRWLQEEGYLVYESPVRACLSEFYSDVDWEKTKAYGVGFNGLCLNLQGREAQGCVPKETYEKILQEIRSKLLSLKDTDGTPVFQAVYRVKDIYGTKPNGNCPDLVLGYNRGYGPSDESVIGTWSEYALRDRSQGFSGHHVADYRLIPGVLLSSRKLTAKKARLPDVTATVLKEYGVPLPKVMTGKPLY